jgi:hypothetical protein
MGMDIGFIGLPATEEVPDKFTWRFARLGEFIALWRDLSNSSKAICEWEQPEYKCSYGCLCSIAFRVPIESFPVLREKMRLAALDPIFFEIVDWLEEHPDVYVEYS